MGTSETLGIAGSGTIACGLAVAAAHAGLEVVLWARSEAARQRSGASIARICGKVEPPVDSARIEVVGELSGLHRATFLVEAVVEHHGSKAAVLHDLAALHRQAETSAVLATTTSSLSIAELARASGQPTRFVGLHVFNPVTRMELVELAFPAQASAETRERSRALCQALGKTAIEVPDIPGFVVNRLLFPYLFSAVSLLTQTGMSAPDIDRCMTLGAGMPMGPLALLDFIGLDVSKAIGEALSVPIPSRLSELVATGALGRKSGRGFYCYG